MSDAKDPDEYIKKFGAAEFKKLIEGSRGKFDFKLDEIHSKYNTDSDEDRIKALGDVTSYIAGVYSSVEREIYISKTETTWSRNAEETSAKTTKNGAASLSVSQWELT